MNAVAGRIWCGYMCPQTVWTDFFMTTERWIEGNSARTPKSRHSALEFRKSSKENSKTFYLVFNRLVDWWRLGSLLADAPTLVISLATLQAGSSEAYLWILILTFTTYVFAGVMRETLLTRLPLAEIQAAFNR